MTKGRGGEGLGDERATGRLEKDGETGEGGGWVKVFHFRELNVYRLAKEVAMEIFHMSKTFPQEEKYNLTDQIRRSSRSVCSNVAEAWRRRKYRAAFIAKINDCETECSETQVWLEFCRDCGYMKEEAFKTLDEKCERIVGMLVRMATDADNWTLKVSEELQEYNDKA